MPSRDNQGAPLPRGDAIRHPVEHARHEVHHLREVADEGESAATPLILIATVIVVLVPIGALWIWGVLFLYNWKVM